MCGRVVQGVDRRRDGMLGFTVSVGMDPWRTGEVMMETIRNTDIRRNLAEFAAQISGRRVDGYILEHGGGIAPTPWAVLLPVEQDGTVLVPQGMEIRRVRRKG